MAIAKKPSYVLRESICAEEEEAHNQEVESWIGRKVGRDSEAFSSSNQISLERFHSPPLPREILVLTRLVNRAVSQGAGTTVWQHRFDHTVVDYRKDASKYHTMPTIVDFPIQAINPMNHKTNTQVHIHPKP
jgi:hypothetical protein